MTFYIISSLLAAICSFCIGIFVYIKDTKKPLNISFCLLNISISVWNFADFLVFISPNNDIALLFNRLAYIGAFFIPVFFSKTIFELISIADKKIKLFVTSILLAFCLVIIDFSPFFIKSVTINPFKEVTGNLYFLFPLFFFGLVFYSLYKLFGSYIKENKPLRKLQLKYVFISLIVGVIAASIYFASLLNSTIPPIHYLIEILYLSIFAYAIIKYRLMDIDLAWRYGASYALYAIFTSALFISLVLFSLIYLPKFLGLFVSSFVIFLGIFVAPYLHKWLTSLVKPAMLGKKYDYWNELDKITQTKTTYSGKVFIYKLVDQMMQVMHLENIQLFMYKENLEQFKLVRQAGINLDEDIHFNNNDAIIKLLNGQRTEIFKEELINNKITYKPKEIFHTFNELNSEMIFPLFAEGNLLGFFSFGKKNKAEMFHKEDIDKIEEIMTLAEQNLTVEILSRKEIFKVHDKYQVHLLETIKQIGELKSIDELSEPITRILMRSIHTNHAAVYLYDPTTYSYTKRSSSEAFKGLVDEVEDNHYLMKLLFEHGEPISYEQIKQSSEHVRIKDMQQAEGLARELNAMIIAPITHNKLLGFIVLGKKATLEVYGRNDYNTLNLVTYSMSIAIQNILFSEEMVRDNLTNLYNRKAYTDKIPELIANSIRTGQSLSLLMIDIDKFKGINDTYGHPVGDEVLRSVSKYIKNTSRPFDAIFRYGGEEIVIISADTDLEGAKIFGERLRDLKNSDVIKNIKDKCKIQRDITISVGASSFKPRLDEIDHLVHDLEKISSKLLELADSALYKAKNNGRDQVCLSEVIIDTKEYAYEWSKKRPRRKKETHDERKRLTIFFSDVSGFSEMSSKVDLDILSNMMNEYVEEMNIIAEKYGGKVLKVMGDGILIVFGKESDKSEESDAVNCLKMGIEMQERMKELNKNWFERGIDAHIGIRIGINTGLVKSTEVLGEKDIMSIDVNIASKIENFCNVDKLLISHSTWGITKDRIKSQEKGEIEIKGLPKKIKVYEVDPLNWEK